MISVGCDTRAVSEVKGDTKCGLKPTRGAVSARRSSLRKRYDRCGMGAHLDGIDPLHLFLFKQLDGSPPQLSRGCVFANQLQLLLNKTF